MGLTAAAGHAAFESFFSNCGAASRGEVTRGPGTAVQVETPGVKDTVETINAWFTDSANTI